MSYSNFGRGGRGYGPQGARAAHRFGRPRFPRPPFRHAAPPRPGHPAPFGMPWQPNNMFFQPHPLRGSPQFRPDGRRRRFCNYDIRFPAPNRVNVVIECTNYEEAAVSPPRPQEEAVPQLPLLGSEEERQQKITETADRLKQKLSSFTSDEMPDIWTEDVGVPPCTEDETESNVQRRIPVVGYKSSEISLTFNDLKDIGKINPDNTQYPASVFSTNNTDSDAIVDENKDGTYPVMPSDQMTNLENVPDDNNEYVEMNREWIEDGQDVNWQLPESAENPQDLEQSNLHGDNNIENEVLESDLRYQYNTLPTDILQDDQQQDTLQEIEMYPMDAAKEQDESETPNLPAVSFPIDSADQDILQDDVSQGKEKLFENVEVQESVLDSHIHAENSNSSNCTLMQIPLVDTSVNNVTLDNQLPRMKDSSFPSGPPRLSPHTEQELPIDFDPTTPPPILLKQDPQCMLPPYPIPDLPPLFDPTAPPPNIKCLLGSNIPHENANPPWSNAQNPMPAAYNNIEVHTGLNTHGGFMPQQLPLEIAGQSNVFLPSHHIDTVNFSPMFPMLSSTPAVNVHVPPILPQMHAASHNTCVSSSSLPELPSSSNLHCSVNKDDGLDDMQEAMRFAKEMTSITGKTDEESKSNSKSLSKSGTSINPISDVESIALPPGKPKIKSNKLKKTKRDDMCSKKKIPEQQSTADHSEEMIDENVRSRDALLTIKEEDRPKVVFNLNNKTKMVSTKAGWKENNEKKNGMTQSVESEKPHVAPSITKKNFESTSRHGKEEEKNLKRTESNAESAILPESITIQNIMHYKRPQKDVHTEKSQHSSVPFAKVNMLNLRSRVEKNENSNMEASWKNRIISRFLKMSKNDIYNMVNNTSLRKFDIIMKRLVKEKKPTLSLEMRQAQDERMKLYDQQEFMKQLNAMLDTDAIVSITDLPTEFIHHLNEVLQLDVQPDNHTEPAAASSSQYDQSEDTNRTFSPVTHTTECANKTIELNDVSQEYVRNKGRPTKTRYNKNLQANNTKNNDLNLKDDTCNTITNVSNVNSLLTLQHDLDDIFSEVTKKIQTPAAEKERKRCSMEQQNATNFDVGAITRSAEEEASLEDVRADRLENSPHWDEKCDRWKRKEREDPHAYRNLTKEEWEARYGTQANSAICIPTVSTKKVGVVNRRGRGLSNRGRGKKVYPRRRYSSESSRNPPNTRHRTLEKDKHKKSRRHSDERGHSVGYLEHDVNPNSNSRSSSSSSSSSTSSTSSSNSSDNTNVTKLLRVIKENEKVAKKITLNEAIRDEINAEIERERKSRKMRKTHKSSKNRKQRKTRYKKKKKQNKKTTSSSDSSEKDDDDDDEVTDRLLTEDEIKKEVVENQITQEVIVKEELDISQEDNIGDTEFVNSLSLMESKAVHLPSASQNRLESPLAQEVTLTAINATQLYAEDRLPTASPTQLKTKAQLKQMPETSDMNDNKVLNVFTCIPENWNTLNPASFSDCTESLNKPCQAVDVGCSQDKAALSTTGNLKNQNDETVDESCDNANKSAVSQRLDDSTKIQGSSEISATDNDNTSKKSTDTISASVSSVSSTSTAAQKQSGSKKIDIKTYYERTIQRRMNEKLESKKPAENPAVSTQNSSTSKTSEPEIPANKSPSVSTYGGSAIQDPRLAARRSEENSNRTVDSDSVAKKIDQNKPKDTVPLAANNINILPDVVTPKIKAPKSKKSEKSATDKKLQSNVPSDSKRFKNIRSEGSKELKLKKEMAKESKAKKPVSPASTKALPSKKSANTEDVAQEKKIDKIGDVSKIETEQVPLASSHEDKVDAGNAKTESPVIFSADNDGNELSRDIIVKAKECSSNSETRERRNVKKTASNVESVAREHPSKTTRDEEIRNTKRATDTANVENANKKSRRELCNVTPELDVPAAAKAVPKVPETSSNVEKINKDSPASNESRRSDATGDADRSSSSHEDPSQVKKSDDPSESANDRDSSGVSETTSATSRVDSDDKINKESLLVNSDIETNDVKENNDAKADVPDDTSESASKDKSPDKKTAEPSSAASKNDRQSTENSATSSDSVGSPFKGFLQEAIMDFEQPNLFNVNYVADAAACKDAKLEDRQDYEALECGTDYVNDASVNVNESFDIAFGGALLASDKECAGSDKSDLTADESGEGHVRKSSGEIMTTMLHEEDNDINIGEGSGSETERQLSMSKEGYASCAGLVIKDSMLLDNEEEIIQGEARAKDLTSKLKTTSDPSLSDAIEATISDDVLRLQECPGVEHLDNHMYLETNISAEKAPCDKLPSFDSDEHLDNIFYLDDRLQSAAAFDNKDDESVQFSVDQQSPRYDITPAVSPETTMIGDLPRAEMPKPEGCKFDLKHIPPADGDLLAGTPVEYSSTDGSRTLNVPTKAALKEAATNLFLKSPSNVSTATKAAAHVESGKTQQSETDLTYLVPAWHVADEQNKTTRPPESHSDASAAQDNVNRTSLAEDSTCGEPARKDVGDADHGRSAALSVNVEKDRLYNEMRRKPIVELRKMKELDKLLEKRERENSQKAKEKLYEDQKKHNGTILNRLKDKRQMKYRSKEPSRKNSLVRRLKKMRRSGKITGTSREAILARMLEIDLEMHKLSMEKLKLHELLGSNVPSTENSTANGGVTQRTRGNDADQLRAPATLTSQNSELNPTRQNKRAPSTRSAIKKRKRALSSEDNENTGFTQRTKTPVIRWKKKPRLQQTIRRKKDEEEENKAAKQRTLSSVSKKVEGSATNAPEEIEKPESNAATNHEVREKTAEKSDKEPVCDIDSRRAIYPDEGAVDKSANDQSEWQDLAEVERTRQFDIDKQNDVLPSSEVAKANSQPSNKQVHGTPESLSIYTDDSTWDSLVQNTASEMHENRKATGLVLLNETLKKELAKSRKMKSIIRKKKKKQLNNYLRTVNNLTAEEEELPLSKLYIKKLRQKRDLLDTLSLKKDSEPVDPDVAKNTDKETDAVNLHEPQSEARASDDIPATSNASPALQSDKHQIFVDAEANANSDWPCREKENVEEAVLQQESNDVPERSNHVFKAVSQDKVPFYDERNVEPDSSVTPEETLMESHSSDGERDRLKDSSDVASRNFDIKVSVPKTLIKDDFSLGLVQTFKDTEGGVADTGLVDSTTNVSPAQAERSEENDKNNSQGTTQPVESAVEEDKRDEKDEGNESEETEGKNAVDATEKGEIDSASNVPSAPQSTTANSDAENEESEDSVASNDKIATIDTERESSVSEKTDTNQKKSDAESEQLSNDANVLKQDCQSAANAAEIGKEGEEEEDKSNPENKSHTEKILDNDQSNGSFVPIDVASEKSEESEASVEQKSNSEHTSTSTSFNKAAIKGGEMSKKRRKHSNSIPVRRSTRNSNENVKSSRMNETDVSSSNSSERDPSSREASVHHERDSTRSRSKSPTWVKHDEKIANNVKKNRVSQKVQNPSSRRIAAESEIKNEDPARHLGTITESVSKNRTVTASKRKRTEWEMKNCKVRLIDCKSVLLKYINPKVLDRLGVVVVNPRAPSDSCTQHITCDQNTAMIPTATSGKSFFVSTDKCCSKEKFKAEILKVEEKVNKECVKKDLSQESVPHVAGIDEEKSTRMQYTVHKGPILDLKVFENSFLAASEDSKIYRYSQKSNGILNIYKGHKSAVTCLYIYKPDVAGVDKDLMYSGSLDGTLRCYNIATGALVGNPAQTKSPIQCMDQAWGMIFIGTKSGHVSRFYIDAGAIKEDSIPFSEKSVLALKATNEGPRRILIIASRNQPINIRDALTGLLLRMISSQKNHTVYSLLRHDNLIYCGTSSTSINVFDFTTGEQATHYDAGVGIVCMRLYKQLLFAGCYDGNIYVFDTNNHKLICSIHGPGNMLLSIEVVNNKIIAGSKDKRLHMWQMPIQVRALL